MHTQDWCISLLVSSINQRANFTAQWASKTDILVSLSIGMLAIALNQPLALAFSVVGGEWSLFMPNVQTSTFFVSRSCNIHITCDCWLKSWRRLRKRCGFFYIFFCSWRDTHPSNFCLDIWVRGIPQFQHLSTFSFDDKLMTDTLFDYLDRFTIYGLHVPKWDTQPQNRRSCYQKT